MRIVRFLLAPSKMPRIVVCIMWVAVIITAFNRLMDRNQLGFTHLDLRPGECAVVTDQGWRSGPCQ